MRHCWFGSVQEETGSAKAKQEVSLKLFFIIIFYLKVFKLNRKLKCILSTKRIKDDTRVRLERSVG